LKLSKGASGANEGHAMRKYLAAAAIGAMLLASQAAASDSGAVDGDDRLGGPGPSASQVQDAELLALLGGVLLVGLLAYGFSHGGKGHPASP
jgi:hypothetical protein